VYNIKKIYTFGTSCTAGGGFEFDSNHGFKNTTRGEYLKFLYKNCNEELSKFNFSWPGQLQKLLPNIDVINLAKSGYGNELIYRKVFDIISNTSHEDIKSYLFLIEFSHLQRKEYYNKKIKDYVILNYNWDGYDTKLTGIANDYFYDSENIKSILLNDFDFFEKFIDLTIEFDEQERLLTMNQNNFLSFLEYNNINYIITSPHNSYSIKNNFKSFDDKVWTSWFNIKNYNDKKHPIAMNEKTSIKTETGGIINDYHNGLIKNKFIAKAIYNDMIYRNFLNMNIIDLEYPSNFKLIPNI